MKTGSSSPLLFLLFLVLSSDPSNPPVAQATHVGNLFNCSDFANQADTQLITVFTPQTKTVSTLTGTG